MKAQIRPVYFDPGRDEEFDLQMERLQSLFGHKADFLEPIPLGSEMYHKNSMGVDAVVFPQILGQAYRCVDAFKAIDVPILIITSEFGTLSMWDWEIISYLGSEGVSTIAPHQARQVDVLLQALQVKRRMRYGRFLVFQDNPGEGFQASIFKRFYWWEDECVQRISTNFGVEIVKRSFKDLAEEAKLIQDARALASMRQKTVSVRDVPEQGLLSAHKLYLALVDQLNRLENVLACGINCLDESHFSDTTPCLAWNLLFEEHGLIWGCEADLLSMLTKYILHVSLDVPVMMTNLYPFLMGDAALKHEKIPMFPPLDEPENHILLAHCGYLGVLPTSFASQWTLRPKVLSIVDDNATAIDARLPVGVVTLAKIEFLRQEDADFSRGNCGLCSISRFALPEWGGS